MKIAHISTVHGAFDDRIFYKECVSLAHYGFETHLIVPHNKSETIDGVHFHPLEKHESRIVRFRKGNKEALKVAREVNADVYHLHDPELLPVGLALKKSGAKVIFDMHELVYLTIMGKTWIPYPFRYLVSQVYLFFEKKAIKNFDHIIVVTSEMKEKYVANNYPKAHDKTSVIRNLTIIKMVEDSVPVERETELTILIYAGGLSEERGIKEVILAIQSIPRVKLWLLGPWADQEYQKTCELSDTNNKVDYKGMLLLEEVYSYMKAADIGMAVLHPTANHLASLPVKSFEYMAAGIPQIMSDFPFWKNSFFDCASFVQYDSIEEIRNAIVTLIENGVLAHKMGVRGFERIKNEYSWEKEAELLVDIYHSL